MRVSIATSLLVASVSLSPGFAEEGDAAAFPNFVLIYIDDLGYGDLSVYGNDEIETPHIDRLAAEGTRFTQFYNLAPLCSPSRVAVLTGQQPHRWRIHSYLDNRARNAERHMADWLDPEAPSLARLLGESGYATLHSGKWHLGGGRDVGDAPHPAAYGFDDSLTSFEGLGERILIEGSGLSEQSGRLGQGPIEWVKKHEMTERYVDRALAFIRENRDRPFYVQIWPDDVHDPFDPKPELVERFRDTSHPEYFAVLDELDRQIGRLVREIDEMGLRDSTLFILASDDGPTAWPHYYDGQDDPSLAPGSTGGLRGRKWSLYEGGLRSPFILRQPGTVPAGQVNETTVVAAFDLLPSLAAIAGVEVPSDYQPDGLDMSDALLGRSEPERPGTIVWEYGTLPGVRFFPGLERDRSPPLAIREGDWKLLMTPDGYELELYNLRDDPEESRNIAGRHPERVEAMREELLAWRKSTPIARHAPVTVLGDLFGGTVRLYDTGTEALDAEEMWPRRFSGEGYLDLPRADAPDIAGKRIRISVTLEAGHSSGVVVAHGGERYGYALYLDEGKPVFVTTAHWDRTTVASPRPLPSDPVEIRAELTTNGEMTLHIDGDLVASGRGPGPIPSEPGDSFQVGADTLSPVGAYATPHPLTGTIHSLEIILRD